MVYRIVYQDGLNQIIENCKDKEEVSEIIEIALMRGIKKIEITTEENKVKTQLIK